MPFLVRIMVLNPEVTMDMQLLAFMVFHYTTRSLQKDTRNANTGYASFSKALSVYFSISKSPETYRNHIKQTKL